IRQASDLPIRCLLWKGRVRRSGRPVVGAIRQRTEGLLRLYRGRPYLLSQLGHVRTEYDLLDLRGPRGKSPLPSALPGAGSFLWWWPVRRRSDRQPGAAGSAWYDLASLAPRRPRRFAGIALSCTLST